jgi:hypothetical protein
MEKCADCIVAKPRTKKNLSDNFYRQNFTSEKELRYLFFILVILLGSGAALQAQLPEVKDPFSGQFPTSGQACSVEKTCAEVAPALIRSALGASPLEENVKKLRALTGGVAAQVEKKDAADWVIAALKQAHADEVHVESFAGGENVVAEVRGRESGKEFVLVGAPLRDACNSALLIDAVRVIESSGSVPRRTIRFVIFTGEAAKTVGALAYTRAHAAEMEGMSAAILFEQGCGAITGYSLNGRKDILAAAGKMLDPVRQLGAADLTLKQEKIAEHLDFVLEGVPTLVAVQHAPKATESSEKNSRAFDINVLKHNVAVASVSIYAFADEREHVGPRQTRSQVGELLQESGLEQQMKEANLWQAWEEGKRGER